MENQNLINAITKALAYTENGGAPDLKNLKAGKSGEMKSIFQFTPATWKNYSQQVTGQSDVPLTPENEVGVVEKKVSQWVNQLTQQGTPIEEIPLKIASMWNAGAGEPDAYSGKFSDGSSSMGTNKYNVAYNVPTYAKKVADYTKEFIQDPENPGNQKTDQRVNPQAEALLAKLTNIAQTAKSSQQGPSSSQLSQNTPSTSPGPQYSGFIGSSSPQVSS